jgi:hypothetical protein
MAEQPDLRQLERKAFRSFFNDGLLEIFIGTLLLCMAAGDILDVIGVSYRWTYPAIAVSVLAFIWAKKRVTQPRVGRVVFGEKRRANRRKLLAVIILVQVLTLGILVTVWTGRGQAGPISGWGALARQMAAGFAFFFIPFGAIAWFLENAWMLIPAILGFWKEALHGFLPKPWIALMTCGVGGMMLAAAGTVLLVRFLRKYPLLEMKANHET